MSDAKPPVTEIVSFPVKEGLKPGEGQENFFGVDAGVGFQGGRFGWQIEDKSVFHWALNWESHDAHKALMDSPKYKPFIGKILEWCTAPSFYHAALSPHPPTPAFTSPVTEVAKFIVKAGKEEWSTAFEKFQVGLKSAPGYKAHSSGWTIEDENEFVVVIGWESVEAHTQWGKSEAGTKSISYLMERIGGGGFWHMRDGGAVTSTRL